MPRRFTVPEKLTMPHPSLRVPSRDSWANLDNFYSNAPHRVKWGHTVTVEMKNAMGLDKATYLNRFNRFKSNLPSGFTVSNKDMCDTM